MWEFSTNFTEVLGGVLFLVGMLAGYRVGRLVFCPTVMTMRRSVRRSLGVLAVFAVVLVLQVGLVALSWTNGWTFASNRVVLALPVVLVPVAAVVAVSVPRLWALARGRPEDPQAPAQASHRAIASDPRLVVPVQAMALGGLLDCWVVFIARPAPPFVVHGIVLWALLVAATALLWLRQRRRQRRFGGLEPRPGPRHARRAATALGALALAAAVIVAAVTSLSAASVLPDRLAASDMAHVDWGGGPAMSHGHGHGGVSVADLTGPRRAVPDVRFTLVAAAAPLRLASGALVDGWTFNGQAPGPELRVHEGDLVEVRLVNHLPVEGVTLHWHGLDVPNAEDGVAGVTQDAVAPGGSHVYRFRPHQVGTFWYHSHQASQPAVNRGLFGALVVLPRSAPAPGLDMTVMAHSWPTASGEVVAFGTADTLERRRVAPGTPVRLRVVNTSDNKTWAAADEDPRTLTFGGAPFRVTAVDGTDVHEPGVLTAARIPMGVGGRYDLTFTMPDHPVRLTDLGNPGAGLLLSPNRAGDTTPAPADAPVFDPLHYGTPAPTPFDATSRFDRQFRLVLDDRPGFYDGHFFLLPTMNGQSFPDTPMLMVARGDLVKTTFVNRGHNDHPMHLHGHHVLVLARNGVPATGSPWWADTVEVHPGDTTTVAFRADNPGVWMDHCHNLRHAAQGMVLHLGYTGVSSPYEIGHATGNRPE